MDSARSFFFRRVFWSIRVFDISVVAGWSVLFVAIWVHMLVYDGTEYWTGSSFVWADWSVHIIYIFNFAYRSLILASHPLYLGEPFRYHFVADLLSALLLRSGATLIQATVLPSILASFALVVDFRDVRRLPERIAEFHKNISPKRFEEMQRNARDAFLSYFRNDAIMRHIAPELQEKVT